MFSRKFKKFIDNKFMELCLGRGDEPANACSLYELGLVDRPARVRLGWVSPTDLYQ